MLYIVLSTPAGRVGFGGRGSLACLSRVQRLRTSDGIFAPRRSGREVLRHRESAGVASASPSRRTFPDPRSHRSIASSGATYLGLQDTAENAGGDTGATVE